ncbi:MAG: MTH1187 family thiamine-binding protein [candidate division KSB1 bacterium]|nr:MTH1187 family thiamine-binding protein [candidate division KSB1 bacterium]MDQ7062747.1 MTH1187 family thiamine-binding protein [candidate division KSB1 bacterium]
MLAEIQFIPIGTGEETKELIAKTVDLIEKSDLDYQLTSMGTIVEGEWDEIMTLVRKCHEKLFEDASRVVTNIVIDDRKDAKNRLKGNVLDIEYALGRGLKTGGLT